MRIPYYGIYLITSGQFEMYHLTDTTYQPLSPNERGHYWIAPMQVELGVWQGVYQNQPEQSWLRWWDEQGNLLPTGQEAVQQERQKRLQLTEKLRSLSPEQLLALGITPEDIL